MNYHGYTVYPNGDVVGLKGEILKTSINRGGYHYVGIRHNKKEKKMKIHRLVALCYLDNPENKLTVNHIDEDKDNNDITNLEWATTLEQNTDRRIMNNNTSGFIGVSYQTKPRKWKASLKVNYKHYYKYFNTIEEAINYRNHLESLHW